MPFAMAVIRDSRIVYANTTLLELLGLSQEQVVGKMLELLSENQGPFIRERHARRLAGEPVPDTYETVLRTARGELHVELTVSRAGEDIYVLVRDLSGRMGQRRVLQRMAALGASLLGIRSEDEVLRRVFEGLAELRMSYAYLVPEGALVRLAHVCVGDEASAGVPWLTGQHLVDDSGNWCPMLRRAWHEGAAYGENLVGEAGQFSSEWGQLVGAHLRRVGPLRALCVRIDGGGAPRALLAVGSDWLGEDELAPWRLFASQVSAALDAARTICRLSTRNTALTSLNRLAAATATAQEPRDLFAPGLEEVHSLMGCGVVLLLLRAEGRDDLEVAWQRGLPEEEARRVHRFTLTGSMSARVMEEGVPRVVGVAEFSEPIRSGLREAGTACVALVPLQVRAHMVGTIAMTFSHARVLTDLERETLQAMGVHFAAAIETHRLLQELRGRAEELTHLHSELEATQRQLVERERLAALGELSAVVAHEVRNPLGAIFNALATLRRFQEPESPGLTLVSILSEEAHRLNRLVDDLLDFARPPSPQPQPVPLAHLLEEAVRTATVDQPRLRVEWALEPDVPPLPMDARMMRQVFLNLALNAVQAMPQGGTLRIRVHRCHTRTGALVEFTDTGPGIPPGLHERLFEPFFTTKATGTGLGLAIVRRTLHAHGGHISIESPPTGGTTFRVRLPL
nr:ATP-binding protein [Melittangium boletus]